MVGRRRRAQRRHRVGDALLRQADHVHVALDHDDLAFLPDRLAGLPQAVQFLPLGEQRRLGRIQILGLALADDAAAKADQAAARIADGEHDPLAEAVVATSVFRLDHQPGLDQRRIVVIGKDLRQPMAVGARPAQPEMRGDLAGQATLLEIADRGRRGLQQLQVLRLGGVQHLRVPGFLGLAARGFGLLSGLRFSSGTVIPAEAASVRTASGKLAPVCSIRKVMALPCAPQPKQ